MKNLIFFKVLFLACLVSFSIQAQNKKPPVRKNTSKKGSKTPQKRRQMPAIGKVFGAVKDAESGKPVEFATVALYNVRSKKIVTGAIANGKGKFSITEIPLGMYEVKINYIGYKVKTIGPIRLFPKKYRGQGLEQNLGEVKIEATAAKLEAVTVTAEREDIEIKADRKVFNVEKNITSTGGTALEALQNVPSIDVDQDGNVSLRGSANVTVFIDGKPSGLTGGGRQAALEQIPASSIKKIEVITNPSAKYDPDGMSGIINIVLKKNVLRGLNGFATASVGTNDKYSGSVRLNLRTGKINTYVTYSGNYFNRFSNGTSNQQNFNGDNTTFIDQINDGDIRFYSSLLKAGMDINIDEKNELSFSALYSIRGFGRDQISDQSFREQIGIGAPINTTSLSLQDNKLASTGNNMDFNVGYKRYFNNPDKLLSFDVRHSRSASLFTSDLIVQPLNLTDRSFDGNSNLVLNETDNTFNITTAQVDFELPMSKGVKLEMGAKTTIRNIFNGFSVSEDVTGTGNSLVPDPTQNNDFRYDEYVYAAYAIFNQQITKKLSFQAGLRVEQTMSDAVVENTDQRFKNEYFNFFPSGFLTYKVSKSGTFNINYSRRINRPRTRALNPFLIRINTNNFYQGNPGLLPEFINSYEMSYTHTWKGTTLNVSSYYRDIRGSIQRFRVTDPVTNITTSTFDNIASGRNYGFELIYNMRPAKWVNFTLSGNFYRTEIDGSNVEGDLNNEAYSYQTKLLVNFKASSKLNFQTTANYRAPIALAQGELAEVYSVDAAVNYKILKGKGTLGFRVSDIFNTRRFGFNTDGGNFIQINDFKPESRIAFLSFSYRFGKISMDARKMRQMRKKRKNRRRRRGNNVPNVDGMN